MDREKKTQRLPTRIPELEPEPEPHKVSISKDQRAGLCNSGNFSHRSTMSNDICTWSLSVCTTYYSYRAQVIES